MYFKEKEYDQMVTRGRSDERVVGKVNLWTGALALILFLGAVTVVLLLALGMTGWAVFAGIVAGVLFILALWDPARVLKKHSRADWRLDGEAPEELKR